MHEYEVPLAEGRTWMVRAHNYESDEASKVVYDKLNAEFRGTGHGDFSVWRTRDPDSTVFLVVLCGAREKLPDLEAPTYELTEAEAHMFALRRAQWGMEKIQAGAKGQIDEELSYDQPMTIDPATGKTVPYRQRETS